MAKLLFALCISLCILAVCAKSVEEGNKSRRDGKLSDQEHYDEKGEHNAEYDHEAFLGKQKKSFDQLTPEESKKRLGWVELAFASTDRCNVVLFWRQVRSLYTSYGFCAHKDHLCIGCGVRFSYIMLLCSCQYSKCYFYALQLKMNHESNVWTKWRNFNVAGGFIHAVFSVFESRADFSNWFLKIPDKIRVSPNIWCEWKLVNR